MSSSNIENEISTIKTGVYGEHIRSAIWSALEKLAYTISNQGDIVTALQETFSSDRTIFRFRGSVNANANLNLLLTGIHYLKPNTTYHYMPTDFPEDSAGFFICIDTENFDSISNVADDEFLQILFPIAPNSFDGTFWCRTKSNLYSAENYGWKKAGGALEASDVEAIVSNYLSGQSAVVDAVASAVDAGVAAYLNTHDIGDTAIDNYIAASAGTNPSKTALKNAVTPWIEDYSATYSDNTGIRNALVAWINAYGGVVDNNGNPVTIQGFDNPTLLEYCHQAGLYSLMEANSDYRNISNDTIKPMVADGIFGYTAYKRLLALPTPQMYGARGNGTGDDTDAIQDAINANQGKTLYFPAGTYIISSTLRIGGTSSTYTDIIMDPSACIKASEYWGSSNNPTQGGGMIVIGNDYASGLIPVTADKAKKKVFIGGVLDTGERGAFGTYGYISFIMRVNNDVTDFDISGTVFLATNTTTALSIGSHEWYAALIAAGKGTSMDSYVHHITLRKYAWNDAADVNSNNNRASGILIHSSDNNFENIRVYYFKRNVKITEGSGNYFSEVHTLGTMYTTYSKDTSGFHIENETNVTLDKCYVDSDDYFLYVAPEAAGSIISVHQCTYYKYSGNGRSMTAFSLNSRNYANSNLDGYNKVTKLFVDGFSMTPTDATTGEYKGIEILSNSSITVNNTVYQDYGTCFGKQVLSYNMSLERIRVLRCDKLRHGDLLKGATSGEKGVLLFAPTTMSRNGSTANSNWYRLCTIPVGYENGMIDYRVKMWLTGRYLEFPFSICRLNSGSSIKVNLGSKVVDTDDNQKYQIAFTNSTTGSLASYTMHMRLIENAASITRGVKRIEFESSTAITPAPSRTQQDYATLPYSADLQDYSANAGAMAAASPVGIYDAGDSSAAAYTSLIITCTEKKIAFSRDISTS